MEALRAKALNIQLTASTSRLAATGVTNAVAMELIMLIMVSVSKPWLALRELENISPTAVISVSMESMLFAR